MTFRQLCILGCAITVLIGSAMLLAGCDAIGPVAVAKSTVKTVLGRPDAEFTGLRLTRDPELGRLVCGTVITGQVQRRFVALMTSDGAKALPVFEDPTPEGRDAFSEALPPTCR